MKTKFGRIGASIVAAAGGQQAHAARYSVLFGLEVTGRSAPNGRARAMRSFDCLTLINSFALSEQPLKH